MIAAARLLGPSLPLGVGPTLFRLAPLQPPVGGVHEPPVYVVCVLPAAGCSVMAGHDSLGLFLVGQMRPVHQWGVQLGRKYDFPDRAKGESFVQVPVSGV